MKALLVLFLLLNLNSLVAQITITKTYYDQNLTETSLEKNYAYLRVEYRDIKNNKRWVDTLFELNTPKKAISYYTIDTNQNVFKQVFRYEDNVLTDIENYKNNKKEGVFKKISNGKIESSKYQSDSLIYKETTAEDKNHIPEKPLDTIVKTATKPSFKGGDEALIKFISENLVYPTKARKKNVTCVVLVIFVINKDGSVTDVEAEQCEDESLKAEAIKVIELTNNLWNPGSQDGKPVKVRAKIPISFDLY